MFSSPKIFVYICRIYTLMKNGLNRFRPPVEWSQLRSSHPTLRLNGSFSLHLEPTVPRTDWRQDWAAQLTASEPEVARWCQEKSHNSRTHYIRQQQQRKHRHGHWNMLLVHMLAHAWNTNMLTTLVNTLNAPLHVSENMRIQVVWEGCGLTCNRLAI